ncbi:AraC family transcriptional regulator [Nocardia inohanensis]|uniref:AraC family transcriptional regulator n=1 Tax=Nocardia inohanensis TaxID=209246 RepID=UPI000AA8FEE9|nr:AraC family transcriptional regulator [Nocardia inohanensis]
MDVLADVLAATKMGGTVAAVVRAGRAWGIRFPELPIAAFHYVVEGECWLRREGRPPLLLSAGDLVLLPQGAGHVMASHPSGPTTEFDVLAEEFGSGPAVVMDLPGPGPTVRIVCGGYRFDAHSSHPMVRLPPVLWLEDLATQRRDVAEVLRMLTTELSDPHPGALTIADRLVDILFVHILRHWAAGDGVTLGGPAWLHALADEPVAAAVSLMHRSPERAWTVALLAKECGLSRATLYRRFTLLVGEPPLTYLTRWRMEITARKLRDSGDSLSAIAETVGYTSEFALSKAFSRYHGMAPSRYRAAHRR